MKLFRFLIGALLIASQTHGQWVSQNSGTSKQLNSICFGTSTNGIAVGSAGTIIKTNDAGTNWTAVNSGTVSDLYSVFFLNHDTGIIVGLGAILKTTDGGDNWTAMNPGIRSYYNLFSVFFTDANTGYASGRNDEDYGAIIKTTDGGSTWKCVYTGSRYSLPYSVFFLDSLNGFAAGTNENPSTYGSFILKTTDGGKNWTKRSVSGSLYSLYFTGPETGYAGGGPGILLKTANGGTTWKNHAPNSSAVIWSVHFSSPDTGYAAAGNVMLKTIDGGETWIPQAPELPGYSLSVFFTDNNVGHASGSSGTILLTSNGGGWGTGMADRLPTANQLNIYPNPASSQITVEPPGKGVISILDINGKVLFQQEIFKSTTIIDLKTMNKGFCVVKFVDGGTVLVKKLLIQ
jgi:photosystem II stability/assembly factor-like uncharacterized protein